MQPQVFKSSISYDEVEVNLLKKPHKAIFKIKSVDDITNHIKLVNDTIDTLKKNDIKWIEISIDFNPIIPSNTISYKNKFNDNLICHVEDFEKFYLSNMENFIKLNHVHINQSKILDDGWTRIVDLKKEKREKYIKIKEEIHNLVGDWNNL